MTEHNTKEQVENSATKTPSKEHVKKEKSTQTKSAPKMKERASKYVSIKGFLITFTFLLSVTALAVSSWLFYQSIQQQLPNKIAKLSQQQFQFEKKISKNAVSQPQIHAITNQISRLNKEQKSQQLLINETQNSQNLQIESLSAKISRLNNTTKEDWKLAEAEYLIRLANQHLLLESNSQNAISLLESADEILNELKDPIVFDTRKALKNDIQALQAIKTFDIEGAYLQLNALHESLHNLPQKAPSKEWQQSQKENSTEVVENTDKITSTLKEFWQAVRSLVTIHYDAKPIKALLPPSQYKELITGLQLQLEIAQVSLLKEEAVIYKQALSNITESITEYFDTKSDTVSSFLITLTKLQNINPSPQLPQPRDSLLSIKALMKKWYQQESSSPPPATEQKVILGGDA